ncbi:hypothetical protein B0A48_14293 [Cryoendolithus antarcticus]|uniref:Uncharacterized protein n=1 Tax=Cryoendolithus antarcticus TaxID=1507870 RepID=A0A1V8SJW4_9PEZI|nr:hypothetical protein B0A48_14293 [Cryoendolithus antarcticus]
MATAPQTTSVLSASPKPAGSVQAAQEFFSISEPVDWVLLDEATDSMKLFALRTLNPTFDSMTSYRALRVMWLERPTLSLATLTVYNPLLIENFSKHVLVHMGAWRSWHFPSYEPTRRFNRFKLTMFWRPEGDVVLTRGEEPSISDLHQGRPRARGSWRAIYIANKPVLSSRAYSLNINYDSLMWRADAVALWEREEPIKAIDKMLDLYAAFDALDATRNSILLYATRDALGPPPPVRMAGNDGSGSRDSGAGWM